LDGPLLVPVRSALQVCPVRVRTSAELHESGRIELMFLSAGIVFLSLLWAVEVDAIYGSVMWIAFSGVGNISDLICSLVGSKQVRRLQCEVSVESVMDYGQHVLLSTGNFLCSAPSCNSTMDFSKKPMEDRVVDSPFERKLEQFPVQLDSPSSVSAMDVRAPSMSLSTIIKLRQRKIYGDANYSTTAPEVPATLPKDSHAVVSHSPTFLLKGAWSNAPSKPQLLKRKRDPDDGAQVTSTPIRCAMP
jgi:hypothetical protein